MFSYLVTYTCLWWLFFYLSLPFNIKVPSKIEKGHADSSPKNPNLGIKALITSIITLPATYYVIKTIENKSLINFFAPYFK